MTADPKLDIDANDIAIVGMGLRFPGARDPARFWKNLCEGVESVTFFQEAELRKAGVGSRELAHPDYVRAGVVLENLDHFDAEFFGLGPKEAAIMDPQHRQFLACAWEALEDSGHPPERMEGTIGVFAGCGMGAYFAFNLLTNPDLVASEGLFLLRHTGNDKDFLATRCSYVFNLTGPSISIQTACSTSLVATHAACQSLLNFECDLALAGGVTIELPHRRGYLFKEGEILSPDGHCRAFDQRARGTIFGSGAGVVALRRLRDAAADGDRIYSVIKGSAVNNDGSAKVGYLAPSVDGQAAAMVEALEVAGLSADSIGYVACHGTGTPVGDPIELTAMTRAFRRTSDRSGYCAIGSVKTNIGHLDTAAGVASLIQASLALYHGAIPPSLNYEQPNPAIDFATSPFFVNDQLRDWPKARQLRRAGVNSLGVGGTNAFVVLEEAPQRLPRQPSVEGPHLLCLSARTESALEAASQRLAAHLEAHPDLDPADVAHTLRAGRAAFECRRVLACRSLAEAAVLLTEGDPQRVFSKRAGSSPAPLAFMFPGGGVQYPAMGRGLYHTEAVFRQWLDRGLTHLKTLLDDDPTSLLLSPESGGEAAAQTLLRPSRQLPLLFLVEYALAMLWMDRGCTPQALIGHSMGENTAAALAGVYSFEQGLTLVALRGRLFESLPAGGMLTTGLAVEALTPLLTPELDMAVVNGSAATVVSGPVAHLERFAELLAARDIDYREIPISVAAHSRMLDPILEEFRTCLRGMSLQPPRIPIISNRDGQWLSAADATDPEYWVKHLRHTVRFDKGLDTLLASEGMILIEVGPGQTLGSLARQHGSASTVRGFIASLRHRDQAIDDETFFATALGRLWTCGNDLAAAPSPRRHISLPTYPFQEKPYWIEPGLAHSGSTDNRENEPARLDFEDWCHVPAWERAPLQSAPDSSSDLQTWLVFLDDAGVGAALATKLRAGGHRVILVREGDAFHQNSETDYVLSPEQGPSGYVSLIRALVAQGLAPTRVLHLWALTADESFRPGSSFFHRNQERGFYSLFFLARALAEECPKNAIHYRVVANGLFRVGARESEGPCYPAKATLLGPCKVIPLEFPGHGCCVIDVVLTKAGGLFAGSRRAGLAPAGLETLFCQLQADSEQTLLALRGEYLYRRCYRPFEPHRAQNSAPFRSGGVYLITGGLGGLGLAVARHLAERHAAALVLVGRTPWPAEEQWDAWLDNHSAENRISAGILQARELISLGARVAVYSADVADIEAMRAVIAAARQRFGDLHGIIHAAGVIEDAPIQLKTQAEVEEVFAPKLHGTLVLDQLCQTLALDFLILFSSTSTAFPLPGQVDYVAANDFLNAYAANQDGAGGTRVMAVAWGAWSQVGMAAELVDLMERGIRPADAPQPVDHPLLESRVTDSRAYSILRARLATRQQWVLDEHRTAAGNAVLPGTAYLELVRTALAEQGETRPFELQDLIFLRPLFVADERATSLRVKLGPEQDGYRLSIQSLESLPGGESGWNTHAEARLHPCGPPSENRLHWHAIAERCNRSRQQDDGGIATGQFEHLRLGPRWRVLREIFWGGDEALARLSLPDRFATDIDHFFLHPALLDMATGFPMALIEGYLAQAGLWVPVSYKRVRFYGRLPARVVSWARNAASNRAAEGVAAFDISIAAEDGTPVLEIEGFAIKKLQEADFVGSPVPARDLVRDDSPSEAARLLNPEQKRLRRQMELGIKPDEGPKILERLLTGQAVPEVLVSPFELAALRTRGLPEADERLKGNRFARPDMEAAYKAPGDEIERTLTGIWEDLLGIEGIGVEDSFFDLGGHSLNAVRLFARIKQSYHVEYPISVLFEAPTIRRCAALIREATRQNRPQERSEQVAGPRHTHLVAMHGGKPGPKTPFFLVAGMFGNVLNLRHLAHLIGTDRPFYGLQARGLYGTQEPHRRFEEMAADYLAEIRTVQPRGPYLLGGFSGGGITAVEMSRQLAGAGEQVDLLALLDTPLPQRPLLTRADKLRIHWRRLREDHLGYLGAWARDRFVWELRRWRARFGLEPAPSLGTSDFHSLEIESAFREALANYRTPTLPFKLTLFRPALDRRFVLSEQRVVSSEKEFVLADNGWTPYAAAVEVHEVPGNHDSMVLEPNVRALAAHLAACIARAEAASESFE